MGYSRFALERGSQEVDWIERCSTAGENSCCCARRINGSAPGVGIGNGGLGLLLAGAMVLAVGSSCFALRVAGRFVLSDDEIFNAY